MYDIHFYGGVLMMVSISHVRQDLQSDPRGIAQVGVSIIGKTMMHIPDSKQLVFEIKAGEATDITKLAQAGIIAQEIPK